MKKVGMGLIHYVFMLAIVLFLIVSLSSCNMTGNVVLKSKNLIIVKLKGLQIPSGVSVKSDTSKVDEVKVDTSGINVLTGDFRYDNMFK